MKIRNNQKGFTLIELIMVITILGILAVAAAPSFIDLTSNAAAATVNGIAASVQDGVNMTYAQNAANGNAQFPTDAQLDSNAVGACTTCFDGVLQQPINDSRWSKGDANTWTYSNAGTTMTCNYVAGTGVFSCS